MRWTICLWLALALLLAGCLGNEGASTAEGPEEPTEPQTGQEVGQATPGSDGNDEGRQGDEGTSHRFGSLTMEHAQRSRPNATNLVFTWEDEVPPDEPEADASFEIPEGIPFEATATVSWEGDIDLTAHLSSPTAQRLCASSETDSQPSDGSGDAAGCAVRSLAQKAPARWSMHVARDADDVDSQRAAVEEAVPFTATVELRALDQASLPSQPALVPAAETDDDRVDPGWPAHEDATLRPGDNDGTGCTVNFLFATPDNATLYAGSAAHCWTHDQIGDPVRPEWNGIGWTTVNATLAYCSWGAQEGLLTCPMKRFGEDEGYRDDFALLRIADRDRAKVHPATLVWGGPTGLASPPEPGNEVRTYGNTQLRDPLLHVNSGDSRSGLVIESNSTTTYARFANPVIRGDSGGPVLTPDGGAVGVNSFRAITHDAFPGRAGIGVANLPHALAQFEENTGRSLELVPWPTFDPLRGEVREEGFPGPGP